MWPTIIFWHNNSNATLNQMFSVVDRLQDVLHCWSSCEDFQSGCKFSSVPLLKFQH